METKKVTVVIGEQPYTISTDEPESYLQELARRVDEMIRQTRAGNPRISANMAAVLTAVTLADEAHRAEESADQLRVRLRDYMAENERLQKQLASR